GAGCELPIASARQGNTTQFHGSHSRWNTSRATNRSTKNLTANAPNPISAYRARLIVPSHRQSSENGNAIYNSFGNPLGALIACSSSPANRDKRWSLASNT